MAVPEPWSRNHALPEFMPVPDSRVPDSRIHACPGFMTLNPREIRACPALGGSRHPGNCSSKQLFAVWLAVELMGVG